MARDETTKSLASKPRLTPAQQEVDRRASYAFMHFEALFPTLNRPSHLRHFTPDDYNAIQVAARQASELSGELHILLGLLKMMPVV